MIIRRASVDDVLEIYNIELECFDRPWSVENITGEILNPISTYFVGELSGNVICYMGYQNILSEGYVTNIAVRKNYRGLGYGKKMMEYFIEDCVKNEICAASLEVAVKNERAIALYTKMGFEVKGLRKNYYGMDKDAYIMWKVLR